MVIFSTFPSQTVFICKSKNPSCHLYLYQNWLIVSSSNVDVATAQWYISYWNLFIGIWRGIQKGIWRWSVSVRILLAVAISAALALEALAQEEIVLSPAGNRELREGERLCGDYFIVRERDGKQRLVFNLGVSQRTRTVFWISFPMSAIAIVVVEGMETAPVARMVFGRKNEGVRNIEVRLSRADYETAQGCLPTPRTKK